MVSRIPNTRELGWEIDMLAQSLRVKWDRAKLPPGLPETFSKGKGVAFWCKVEEPLTCAPTPEWFYF